MLTALGWVFTALFTLFLIGLVWQFATIILIFIAFIIGGLYHLAKRVWTTLKEVM